jgi:Nucleotidyltransferase of unknown function (DUF6036)
MPGYERVRRVVLGTDDPTERKIRFMALLTSALPKGKKPPILVGGSAIEIYLDGTLRTGDVDVVYKVKALKKILASWRFELGRGLRAWANEELVLAVDMVGEEYIGSYDRVTTITTDYGPVTVTAAEDLIVKRLSSAKFWSAPADVDQAYLLAKAHGDRIDWPYVEGEARKADVTDYLSKLKGMLGGRR